MSQPQKNSGIKRAAKQSSISKKNNSFVSAFLEDASKDDTADIHVSRVIKKFGNGRVQVFYVDEENKPKLGTAVIRGNMRGRGKRSVWIDIGTIVVVAQTELHGLEIMAVLDDHQVDQVKGAMKLDERIFAIDLIDEKSLLVARSDNMEGGYEFEGEKEVEIGDL